MPFLKNLQDRLNDQLTSLEQDGLRPDEAWKIVRYQEPLLKPEPGTVEEDE